MAPPTARFAFASVAVDCQIDDEFEGAKAANSLWERLQAMTTFDPPLNRFHVPDLRRRGMDPVYYLAEEIPQFNSTGERLSGRICRIIEELDDTMGSKIGIHTVQGVPINEYIENFMWDTEKYPITSWPEELFESIKVEIGRIQEEFEDKLQMFNQVKNKLRLMRKDQACRLAVRDLSLLIKPDDLIFSEYLSSLLIVVPKESQQDWLSSYEFIDRKFVVPRSSQLLYEDEKDALYNVTIFSRVVDKFIIDAQAKGFLVRSEYNPELLKSKHNEWEILLSDKEDSVHFLYKKNAEVVTCLIHLAALRIYSESHLRYGPHYLSFAGLSNPRNELNLKEVLEDLSAKSMVGKEPFFFTIKVSDNKRV